MVRVDWILQKCTIKKRKKHHIITLYPSIPKKDISRSQKNEKALAGRRNKIEFKGLNMTSRNWFQTDQSRSTIWLKGLSSRDLSQEDSGDGGGTGHHDGTADSVGSTSVLRGAGTVNCQYQDS